MSDNHFENIELYLLNKLSPAEKALFEKALETDTQLQEEFRIYKEVNDILSRRIDIPEEEKLFRKKLQARQARYFSNVEEGKTPKSKKIRWISIASIAAAAAIIIFLTWSPSQQNLLQDYGQIQMVNPTVRGDEQHTGMADISRLFNQGKYKEVLPLLDSAITADPANTQDIFYRGITFLHLENTEAARKDLQIVFDGTSIYRYNAAYFMALSFLQEKDTESAKVWLQKIPSEASVYGKAQELLHKAED